MDLLGRQECMEVCNQVLQRSVRNSSLDTIQERQKEQYEIALVTSDYSFSDAERTRIESMGFILKDNVYYTYVSENMDKLMKIIKQCFTINTTNESED